MTTPLRDAVIRLGLDDARLRDANRGLVTLESNLGKVASAAKLSGAQLKAASGGAVATNWVVIHSGARPVTSSATAIDAAIAVPP